MELLQLKQKWASDAGLSLAPPCSSFLPSASRTSSGTTSKESSPGCSSGVEESDSFDRLSKRMRGAGDEPRRVWNVELHESAGPLPCGWEQFLDLQSGEMYYYNARLDIKTRQDPRKGIKEPMTSDWSRSPSNLSVLRTWNSYTEQLRRMAEATRVEQEKLASRRRVVKGHADKREEHGSDGVDLSLRLSISKQGMKQRRV